MSPGANPFYKSRRFVGCSLLFTIALLIASAYCGTLASPPYLDDFHSFIHQDKVFIKDASLSSLVSISQTVFGWKRWIPMLTFALTHKYGDSQLYIFHMTNILIHILAMFGVFFLASELFRLKNRDQSLRIEDKYLHYCAFCIAALWALHPIQTSAVTYLVQRMASIQAMFFLFSMALFIRGRRIHTDSGIPRRYIPCYAGCFLTTICAFFSKENSYILPVMFFMTEIWFFRQDLHVVLWNRFRKSGLLARCLLGLCALFLSWFAWKYFMSLIAGYEHRDFTMFERLLTEARVVVWYLSLLVWPDPSRLSMEHDFTISRSFLDPLTTLPSFLFLAVLLWQVFRQRKRYPILTFGGLWFFANLAIESSIFPLELVFEHRLYLPSFGFVLIVVVGFVQVCRLSAARATDQKQWMTLAFSVLTLLTSGLTLLTYDRNDAWSNHLSLNIDNTEKASQNPRAHSNLASSLLRLNQFDEAIAEAEKSIALGRMNYESYAVAANTIVLALVESNRIEEAMQRGERLIDELPKDYGMDAWPIFLANLARAYQSAKRYDMAYNTLMKSLEVTRATGNHPLKKKTVTHLLHSLLAETNGKGIDLDADGAADPGDTAIPTWIAWKYYRIAEYQGARELLDVSLARNPADGQALELSALLQKEEGDSLKQKEKADFARKYVARPFSLFNAGMAVAYLAQEKQLPSFLLGIGESALDHCLKARPESADAHLLKGWYHYRREDVTMAVEEAERAIQLDPEYARAWIGYGFFLAGMNRAENAVAAFDRALQLHPRFSQRNAIQALATSIREADTAKAQQPPESSAAGAHTTTPSPLNRNIPPGQG